MGPRTWHRSSCACAGACWFASAKAGSSLSMSSSRAGASSGAGWGGDLVGELDQRHGLELASPDNHGTFDEETADMVEWGYVG